MPDLKTQMAEAAKDIIAEARKDERERCVNDFLWWLYDPEGLDFVKDDPKQQNMPRYIAELRERVAR